MNKIMWYNVRTHEYKWAALAPEELKQMVSRHRSKLLQEVSNIEHKLSVASKSERDLREKYKKVLGMWDGDPTAVEIVHSLMSLHDGYSLIEFPTSYAIETGTHSAALADQALLQMRADTAEDYGSPPNEPGVWRSCIPTARPLRDMWTYAKHREPKSPLCDGRSPKNGTHVDCCYMNYDDIVQPVWKREMGVSGKCKMWRCTLEDWTEHDRLVLHELARGWGGWGSKVHEPLPWTKRGAVRIKGFPWSTLAETSGSILEGLFVFDIAVRAGTLERSVLQAVWTPVSFEVWEEEVWHFGLYDVVFERDAHQRETDDVLCHLIIELVDRHDNIWHHHGQGSRGGKNGFERRELAATEIHALLLVQHTCVLEWSLSQLPDADPLLLQLPRLPPLAVWSYSRVCRAMAMLRSKNALHTVAPPLSSEFDDQMAAFQKVERKLSEAYSERLQAATNGIDRLLSGPFDRLDSEELMNIKSRLEMMKVAAEAAGSVSQSEPAGSVAQAHSIPSDPSDDLGLPPLVGGSGVVPAQMCVDELAAACAVAPFDDSDDDL